MEIQENQDSPSHHCHGDFKLPNDKKESESGEKETRAISGDDIIRSRHPLMLVTRPLLPFLFSFRLGLGFGFWV